MQRLFVDILYQGWKMALVERRLPVECMGCPVTGIKVVSMVTKAILKRCVGGGEEWMCRAALGSPK